MTDVRLESPRASDDDTISDMDDNLDYSSSSEQDYAPPGTLFSRRHMYQHVSSHAPPSDNPPAPPSENPVNEPCQCGRQVYSFIFVSLGI